MDLERLAAAGLYDPGAADRADRLDVLEYIVRAGVSIEDMVESNRQGNLSSVVFDLRIRQGDTSANDLAERSATPLAQVLETYRLLGIAVRDPNDLIFTEAETRLFEVLSLGAVSLPEGMTEEILRSIGWALTIVAEAAVSAFVGSVEDLLQEGSQRTRAEVTTMTGELGLELGDLMGPLFRHHLWSAVQRQRAAMINAVDRRQSEVSIGFVDLVGFTSITATMDSDELLAFMRQFHSRTYDVVTRSGGRVVKHIGDEIMFTSGNRAGGCEIALALIEAFDDADSLPRGGLAHGMVVARHGDFYGPVVNLAARLTDIAVPGEVLADASIAELPVDHFSFEAAGRRQLKGFLDPVTVVSVSRAD